MNKMSIFAERHRARRIGIAGRISLTQAAETWPLRQEPIRARMTVLRCPEVGQALTRWMKLAAWSELHRPRIETEGTEFPNRKPATRSGLSRASGADCRWKCIGQVTNRPPTSHAMGDGCSDSAAALLHGGHSGLRGGLGATLPIILCVFVSGRVVITSQAAAPPPSLRRRNSLLQTRV